MVCLDFKSESRLEDSAFGPLLGISLAVLAVFGGLAWRGRRRQLSTARATKSSAASFLASANTLGNLQMIYKNNHKH